MRDSSRVCEFSGSSYFFFLAFFAFFFVFLPHFPHAILDTSIIRFGTGYDSVFEMHLSRPRAFTGGQITHSKTHPC
jgi:hypothetical protein